MWDSDGLSGTWTPSVETDVNNNIAKLGSTKKFGAHLKLDWTSAGFSDMPEPSAKKQCCASKDIDLSFDAPPNNMLEQILGVVNGISARLSVVESKVNGNQIDRPVDDQRQLLDRSLEVQLTLLDKSADSAAAVDSAADIAAEQSSLAETARKLLNKLN